MKICKKIVGAALAAVMAIGTCSAFAANAADSRTPEELPIMSEANRVTISDAKYAAIMDEMVLVDQCEAVEDGLTYVASIYSPDTAFGSTGTNVPVAAKMDVYDGTPGNSIRLFSMEVLGFFTWNQDENSALIDNKNVYTNYHKYVDQEYPVLTPIGHTALGEQGGFIGSKYAYIEYQVKMEKKKGEFVTCKLWLDVNVKGERTVKCTPANITKEVLA